MRPQYNTCTILCTTWSDPILDLIVVILPLFLSRIWQTLQIVRAGWQAMRKSDIRYPRATTDPRPSEGHIATEIIKCQVRGTCKGKGCGLHVHGIAVPGAAVDLKGLCFYQASWSAGLTRVLWLFSLTASRAYWLPGTGRSIIWWVLMRAICFYKENDFSMVSCLCFLYRSHMYL